MREILVITWKFNNTGGDWTYCYNITKEYIAQGFRVTVLTTNGNVEDIGQMRTLFTESLLNERKGLVNKLKLGVDFIRQNQLSETQKKFLRNTDWYLVHVHSLMGGVGFNVLGELNNRVPIMYTLHDYHLICPTSNAYIGSKNCFDCSDVGKFALLKNNCRHNYLESGLVYLQRQTNSVKQVVERVNYFLCPSEFMYNRMADSGIPKEKLILNGYCLGDDVLFIEDSPVQVQQENYILFAGRLETYKGLDDLLKVCRENNFELKIAGDGSLRDWVINEIKTDDGIEYLGKLDKFQLNDFIRRSMAVCVPSKWNENFPFAVTEALLQGKIVIGSNKGGIPELVKHGKNGYVFDSQDISDLKGAIIAAKEESVEWSSCEIKEDIRNRFNAKNHLENILNLI